MRAGEVTGKSTAIAEHVVASFSLISQLQGALLVDALGCVACVEALITAVYDSAVADDVEVLKSVAILTELCVGLGAVQIDLGQTRDNRRMEV